MKRAWAMQVETTSEAHPDAQTIFGNLQFVQSEMKTPAGLTKMRQYAAARRKHQATAAASPTAILTQGSTVTNLRPCGFPGCSMAATKRCSACKGQWYCSQEHQRSDWKAHKVECKRITKARKAAAASAGGAAGGVGRLTTLWQDDRRARARPV